MNLSGSKEVPKNIKQEDLHVCYSCEKNIPIAMGCSTACFNVVGRRSCLAVLSKLAQIWANFLDPFKFKMATSRWCDVVVTWPTIIVVVMATNNNIDDVMVVVTWHQHIWYYDAFWWLLGVLGCHLKWNRNLRYRSYFSPLSLGGPNTRMRRLKFYGFILSDKLSW